MPARPRSLAIIGSGPAGYTAALYAARAGLAPVLYEGSATAGGALMTTTTVENFPGHPEPVTGPDLMAHMRTQAERFGCELVREDVIGLEVTGSMKTLETVDGRAHTFEAVILATGAVHKKLGLPGEERLTGRGLSTCATCDGAFYRDRPVAVVGGGDSALEEALHLTRFASSVTLIHRRDRLRGSKVMQTRVIAHPKITVRWNTRVTGLVGEHHLEAATLQDDAHGHTYRLVVDGLFVAIGHKPNSELVRGQVPVDDDGYVVVDHPTTATKVPGVFACGDLVDRRYRQAITAAGSGCAAALDAERYVSALRDSPGRNAPGTHLATGPSIAISSEENPPTITVEAVDDTTLARAVRTSSVPVLVDFWADNCAPCRLMSPVLDDIARRYSGKLRVVKLNTDRNPEAARRHGINAAPTLMLFVAGEVAHTIMGATPGSRLAAELEPFVS